MIDRDTVGALEIFAAASAPAQRILAERGTIRRYAPGEVLFTTGSPCQGLLVIIDGRVRVTTFRWERPHAVHEETAGGTLGEVPLYAAGAYPATAVAAQPTTCAVLSADAIRAALRADPDWAWVLLARMAHRVRHLVGRLDRNTAPTVPGRIASLLLERHAQGAGEPFLLGESQQEVAEDLGTVREVVVRTLARLRRANLVRTEGRGRYRVVDPRGLAAIVEGKPV